MGKQPSLAGRTTGREGPAEMVSGEAKSQSCRTSQAKFKILTFNPKNSGEPLMCVIQGNAIGSAFFKGNFGCCKVQ